MLIALLYVYTGDRGDLSGPVFGRLRAVAGWCAFLGPGGCAHATLQKGTCGRRLQQSDEHLRRNNGTENKDLLMRKKVNLKKNADRT